MLDVDLCKRCWKMSGYHWGFSADMDWECRGQISCPYKDGRHEDYNRPTYNVFGWPPKDCFFPAEQIMSNCKTTFRTFYKDLLDDEGRGYDSEVDYVVQMPAEERFKELISEEYHEDNLELAFFDVDTIIKQYGWRINMSQENWDDYFFKMCNLVASKSKDRSTKIGTVIVGKNHEVRSTGYNGFPRGVNDEIESRHERPAKYLWTEHAERNALFNAARVGIPTDECRIYLEWYPCADCARGIIQAGIVEVVLNGNSESFKDQKLYERWKDQIEVAKEMFKEAGVNIRIVK